MSPLTPRSRRVIAATLVAFTLAATACSGGVRPTLTSDRLDESALADPTEPVAAAAPTAAPVPDSSAAATADPATSQQSGEPVQLTVEILETLPHDTSAFTQGLELDNGVFIESTGLNGESDLRRVVPATGEVTQQVATPNDYFAEGVTKVGDELIQLTWTENTAFYWDASSFELKKEVRYEGDGWGLCYDGARLVMSDGTAELVFRDPTTFGEISRVAVTLNNQDVFNINELECVGGAVWANIWQTDLILRIDPATGVVTGVVDASSLDAGTEAGGAVLNGIAWDETTQSFYVTGKLWPNMYRVNFVPAPGN